MGRRLQLAAACACAVILASPVVQAQNYPTRPVTMIVPFAPGGGTDAVARALGPALGAKLGQSIVIENVSGGAGNIGASRAARATPDGYTLLMHNVAFALNVALYPRLPFDPEKDFTPIAYVNTTPLVHVGRKTLPANSVTELVAWMKSTPPKMAHPGVGSTGHIAAALLAQAAGVKADHVPYRGGGPALQDVIAGHVDTTAITLQNAIEPVNSGLVKGLGITAPRRAKALPNVPSLVEELGPTVEVLFWNVLVAPAGTPKDIIEKVRISLDAALQDKELLELWEKAGIEVYPPEQRTTEGARALLRKEIERWRQVVRDNNIETPTP
jgi:tripartite-type tricarboxylate transporter receptor subunit TctC